MKRFSISDFRFPISRGSRNTDHKSRIRLRGVTYIELLMAVLIISIVGAGAAATWGFSSRVPANLRVTEMASKIAVREIELVKAQKYINSSAPANPDWYDKNGAFIISQSGVPSGAVYKAVTTVGMPVVNGTAMTATGTTKDLLEVVVTVTDTGATKTYETQRALMTFGGF